MNEMEIFATSAARDAGALLKNLFSQKHTVDFKGDINIVTEADKLSEELIVSKIAARFPTHDILSEESVKTDKGSDYCWIIDPIDGTTNYAHGFPFFCVSIALKVKNAVTLGVIYNPMLDELFVATEGGGARLNGSSITVSDTTLVQNSLLATGFPYDIRVNNNNNITYFIEMAYRARAIRRAGAAALDLAYLAAGRFDGFWELRLHPWDVAAGQLLVREAGGIVTDMETNDFDIYAPAIVASNAKIHDEMISILKASSPFFEYHSVRIDE
ncbi:MAG: inositol monophosphatase [Syntrophales bacterium]|jgi:myo-inositol-1(or 4)-monophosphatase|nr:inositol monophosphatase [Syntrophales bacterium]MDY0043428.1 inositol monophosphatase family protein [Syntrophales bacterium]